MITTDQDHFNSAGATLSPSERALAVKWLTVRINLRIGRRSLKPVSKQLRRYSWTTRQLIIAEVEGKIYQTTRRILGVLTINRLYRVRWNETDQRLYTYRT